MDTYKDKILSGSKQMDLNKFIDYLEIMNKCKYKNETQKIIDSVINSINDDAQISALKRIIGTKPQNIGPKLNEKHKCPHCNKKNNIVGTDDYIICGYTNKGYDWNGCGKDWCNGCSKKLCKQWGTDSLFNRFNRIHTSKCCKKHAKKVGADYLTEYCQCTDKYYKT